MYIPEKLRVKLLQDLHRIAEQNKKEFAALREWMSEQCKKNFAIDNNLEKTLAKIKEHKSQIWQTYQENDRRRSEWYEGLQRREAAMKKKEESRAKAVMAVETSLHVSGLTGPQIDSRNEHTKDVCDEDDRMVALDRPSEGCDISTCGGQDNSTSDHEEEIASSSCDEVQDDFGVDTPKGDGALTQGESSLEQGLTLQDVHMGDDQSSATHVGEYVDEGSTFDPRSSTGESVCQHGRDVGSYESHYLVGQLKVRDDMTVVAMRHLDDTQALVAKYCWRVAVAHDNLGREFSIRHSKRE
jgi:hypothetical protein